MRTVSGSSKQLRLAVFDCDGTLVDSQHSIIASMRAAFNSQHLPCPEDYAIRRTVGLPLMEAVKLLHPGVAEPAIERLCNSFNIAWRNICKTIGHNEPLYDGCKVALDVLAKNGWSLGIATGKSYNGLVGALKQHGLLAQFSTLQTADRALGKPDPSMLFQAMDEIGASPADTVMIGDTTYDMEMAVNAGVLAIGVAWGYHNIRELEKAGACMIVRTYEELPALLQDLLAE